MHKINYRQFAIIVFLLLTSSKFISLPSLLAQTGKNDAYIALAISLALEVLFIYIIVKMLRDSGEQNLYVFIKKRLGSVCARIICILLTMYSLLLIMNLIKSYDLFVGFNLYYKFSWLYYVLPLMAVAGFMAYKGIRNIGRTSELLYFFIIAGLVYILIKAVSYCDITFVLPFMKEGFSPIALTVYRSTAWFGSGITLFLMFGDIDLSTRNDKTLHKYIIMATLLIYLSSFVFFGVFGETAIRHPFAISDLSQISTKGGLDELQWLVVCIWMIAQTLQIAILTYCASRGIRYGLNINNKKICIFAVVAMMIVWVYFGNRNLRMANVFYTPYIIVPMMVVQFAIPLVLVVANAIYQKRSKV